MATIYKCDRCKNVCDVKAQPAFAIYCTDLGTGTAFYDKLYDLCEQCMKEFHTWVETSVGVVSQPKA